MARSTRFRRSGSTIKPLILRVDPAGSDAHDGRRRPLASPEAAMKAVARARRGGHEGPIDVVLAGGTYWLKRPLTIKPAHSGVIHLDRKGIDDRPTAWTTIRGEPGERVVLSAGRRVRGFQPVELLDPDQPDEPSVWAWVARVPASVAQDPMANQLWVNGRRAHRPRWPREGEPWLRVGKRLGPVSRRDHPMPIFHSHRSFRFGVGEVWPFHNTGDVEMVALHFWIESRIPIAAIDTRRRVLDLAYHPRMALTDDYHGTGAPYYLDNVFELLEEPGQWYLDRSARLIFYVPRPGESIGSAEVVLPGHDAAVVLAGEVEKDRPVQAVRIENLVIAHASCDPGEDARRSTPQAACHVPGAVRFQHARRCILAGCTVEQVSGYGVAVTHGSSDCAIERCLVRDAGGGGVMVFHTPRPTSPGGGAPDRSEWGRTHWHCRRIGVRDCEITDLGHYYRQAVGVLIGQASGCRVEHNHIHALDYTGISVGWRWGYGESEGMGNIIEFNHVHDIGRGVLSDMGGIYLLGHGQGTRVRFNHIHDVTSRGYGGWGIYPDEGSTDLLIEGNVVHDTNFAPFHQHFGRDNVLRHNIFAFGGGAFLQRTRLELHDSFLVERNLFVTDHPIDEAVQMPEICYDDPANPHGIWRENLYFHPAGPRGLRWMGRTWSQWRREGQDRGSVFADPGFVDPAARDFRLGETSPARALGFVETDLARVGPRHRPGASGSF